MGQDGRDREGDGGSKTTSVTEAEYGWNDPARMEDPDKLNDPVWVADNDPADVENQKLKKQMHAYALKQSADLLGLSDTKNFRTKGARLGKSMVKV